MKLSKILFYTTFIISLFYSFNCANDVLPENSGNCKANGSKSEVSLDSGHIHTLSAELTPSEIATATEVTKSLNSSSSHVHEYTISKDRFIDLQLNRGIGVKSTETNVHKHDITINCK